MAMYKFPGYMKAEEKWETYKKKTKGMEQMGKSQWYNFNYGVGAPSGKTSGLKKYAEETGKPSFRGASGSDLDELNKRFRRKKK